MGGATPANAPAMSVRILAANKSRKRGPNPPYTSTLLVTLAHPPGCGSIRWSNTTLPRGNGHSLAQRRYGSTTVIVKGPPRVPPCLAQPDLPAADGPSRRAVSLLGAQRGQSDTSVQKRQTCSGSAPMGASP